MRKSLVALLAALTLLCAMPLEAAIACQVSYCGSADNTSFDCRTDASGGGAHGGALNTTGDTLLVMGVACYNARCAGDTPVDAVGACGSVAVSTCNPWTALTAYGDVTTLSYVQLFYVNSATPTVGASHVFTAGTLGGNLSDVAWVWACSGTDGTQLRAASNVGAVCLSSPSSCQGGSTGANTDVVFSVMSDNLDSAAAQTVNLSFVQSQNFCYNCPASGTVHITGSGGYLVTTGAVNPTWGGFTGATDAVVTNVAFKAAGGGPPPCSVPPSQLTTVGVGNCK